MPPSNAVHLPAEGLGYTAQLSLPHSWGEGWGGGRSDPEDLDGQVPLAGPVEFEQKNPLPAPEIEPAVGDRNVLAAAEQQMLAMRMPVGALIGFHGAAAASQIVVPITGALTGEPIE